MAKSQESDMVPSPREEKARKNSFQHLVQFLLMPDPEQNSDPLLFIAQHVIPKFHCVKKNTSLPHKFIWLLNS